ncbi:general secretion pathway protein GspK [Desulfonatronum thioautotrophicum]|uniref:general secretion pathway protein GspK n=1 Tax=Desulfonatronum thioautotrophicum TaxID=617001 RepID=UPI0005EBD065|nr:type II secretion system protein GspK [Desulfonatronum thioautotrophicum]
MHRIDRSPRCPGSVLVLVLVTLLLFSTVTLRVVHHAALAEEEHVLLLQSANAAFQAEAAVHKALEIISSFSDHIGATDPPLSLPRWQEDGIRITITPTNTKLNLNALHPPFLPPQAMARMQDGLERFLRTAEVHGRFSEDPRQEFQGDMRNILRWLGEGHDPDQPDAARAADAPYSGFQPSYRPRKGPMQRPEELLLVAGFSALDPEWVRQSFTVWGTDGRINLNLAEEELILALAPELRTYWPGILRHRTENGFQRLDELITRVGLPMDLYQRVLPHLTISVDILEVLIEVRQPAWYEQHRLIVERPSILTDIPPRILARDIIVSRPIRNTDPLPFR